MKQRGKIRFTLLLTLILFLPSLGYSMDMGGIVNFSGYIQSDMRYIIEDYRGPKDGEGYEFELNRNEVDLRLDIYPNDKVLAVFETKLRFDGYNNANNLKGLTERTKIDPFYIQLEEAYLGVRGLFWEGIDLKIGRMVQNWGAADFFNPTDNINARDFSDTLDYSAKVPNQMVEIDIYPADWLELQFVWVPIFKPSQLPQSSLLGFSVENDDKGCLVQAPTPPLMNPADNKKLFGFFNTIDPCSLNFLEPQINTIKPSRTLANSQAAVKAKFRVSDLDFSLSYYYGRFSFPIPVTASALVEPNEKDPNIQDIEYTVELMYPRMHVAGFDFSYSSEYILDIGIIGEMAVIFPEKIDFALRAFMSGSEVSAISPMASEAVPDEPFIKATVGLDYTFTYWLYVNLMYVRGFFDEFNDVYGIHNYMTWGLELKFLENELQIRFGGAWNADDMTATLNPQITWIVYPSVELIGGALIFIGDTKMDDPLDYSSKYKFGQKAVGRNIAFLKAKVSW